MAGSFVQSHTAGTSASTTDNLVTATLLANVPAGNVLLIDVGADSLSATTPTVSSIDKPGGETATWTKIASHGASSATSLAAVVGELWLIKTTQTWPSGTVITVTFTALGGVAVKRGCMCHEFTGLLATLRSTSGTNTSTTAVPSATTTGTTPVIGDVALGIGTFEGSGTSAGDADTTSGAWSTAVNLHNGGGASAAQNDLIFQYKVIAATAAHQTYNPTSASGLDSGAAVAVVQQDPNATVTPAVVAATVSIAGPTIEAQTVAAPPIVAAPTTIPVPSITAGGADTEPPTVPANLHTTSVGSTTVDLAWDAATDNVAVSYYEVIVRPG